MKRQGFYTVKQVAEALGIAKNTLYNWEMKKKVPKAKRHPMNNYRVYTEDDVKRIKKTIERGLE